jgi:hypothetical protein
MGSEWNETKKKAENLEEKKVSDQLGARGSCQLSCPRLPPTIQSLFAPPPPRPWLLWLYCLVAHALQVVRLQSEVLVYEALSY